MLRVEKFIRLMTVAAALLAFTSISAMAKDTWTVRKELSAGQVVDIQTMYNITLKTCVGDAVPPKPVFKKAPKLGKVTFWEGETAPRQCPSTKVNARFAKYTAGNVPGRDRFTIHWKSTGAKKAVYRATYIITVK